MKVTRWFLCHLLSIILLAVFVLIFYFWSDLKNDVSGRAGGEPQTESVATEKKPIDQQEKSISTVPASVSAEKNKVAPPQTGKDDPWGDVFDGTNTQVDVVAEEKAKADIALESNFPPENYDPESAAAEEKSMQSMIMNEAGKRSEHTSELQSH